MKTVSVNNRSVFIRVVAIGLVMGLVSTGALAADELGDGICSLVNVLTGKWLFGGSILAILAGGVPIMLGAEMTDLIKKIFTIVTVLGLILGATSILTLAFSKFSGMTC